MPTPHPAILFVDDDDALRAVTTMMLQEAGWPTFAAGTGPEAVHTLQSHPEIGAVLLDATMPGMPSDETCRQVHALRPEIPVILLSGYDEQDATARFHGEPVAGFVQKPYELEDLTRILASTLAAVQKNARS